MRRNKLVSAQEAVGMIQNGWVLGVEGFVGAGTADELCLALEERFLQTGSPTGLTVIHSSGPGDAGMRGLNRVAHKGIFKRAISGHYGLVPQIGKLALENELEAYNLPQGVLTNFYRAVAGRRPGVFTQVGLGTFADPRLEGGKISPKAVEDIVEVIEIAGREWLFMKSFAVDCVFIRGTTADTRGNVTMEREILTVDALAMAMAAKNSGGIVIAQVERMAVPENLNSRNVVVPGILVDYVVVARPEYHMQTFGTQYRPELCGELRVPLTSMKTLPLDERKVMARRANLELRPYDVINLGIGYPEAVSAIANEENILGYLTMTVEPGIIGGMPLGGLDFGASVNAEAVVSMPDQFDFYDGGGLDLTCLGFAQCDPAGNVNSSKFGPRVAGCGGFIDISQNAKRVLFMGTFTTGGVEIAVENGTVKIIREGKIRKFVKQCDQITFCSRFSESQKQEVFYITERCVFKLKGERLVLIEVAPGIDIRNDILAKMDFEPLMEDVKPMDSRIFQKLTMKIRNEFLIRELQARVRYDSGQNMLQLNFNGLELETIEDVENMRSVIEDHCRRAGRKIKALVNYDAFKVNDELLDAYMDMGHAIIDSYYLQVARHTTNPMIMEQLSSAFKMRGLDPNIFPSRGKALEFLKRAN
jgi:propionate CoA-transferase